MVLAVPVSSVLKTTCCALALCVLALPAAAQPALRGITVGPIESSQHKDRGYGSDKSRALLDELVRIGANAVSITPFGRLWSLSSTHIDASFEWPVSENERAVADFIADAKARGLRRRWSG